MNDCIFCQLINKQIPTKIVYEDNEIFVFNDINPKAEVHLLVIPKKHIESLLQIKEEDQLLLGKMMIIANKIACDLGLQNGYKTQINTGIKGGQEVMHLHIHIVGNR